MIAASRTELGGRARELELFRSLLDAATRGRPRPCWSRVRRASGRLACSRARA